ncbi:MAG: HypC/HybG/HupF family hydrogenase formation chaperone [Caldisericales bacterium]|nr:HypC/HybG/HupF family hydrogenase formation chaperone [bacterium]
MCLAVPARIYEKKGLDATVEFGGVKRQVRLDLLPDAEVGEFVLLHAGFAIEKVNKEEAESILKTIQEVFGDVPV